MKLFEKFVVGAVGFTLLVTVAYAQWQVPDHSVPIGNGAGVTGFASATPSATSGVPLISQGAVADPVFGTSVVAGGGTGNATLTSGGVLVGNGTGAIISNRCTMDANQSIACTSSGTNLPNSSQINSANDASPSFFTFAKSRAGGDTLNGDFLGLVSFRGFANAGGREVGRMLCQQSGASVGSNIPVNCQIITSSNAGAMNKAYIFEGQTGNFLIPAGGNVTLFGSSSGATSIGAPAAAGNNALVVPTAGGTFAISTGATAPLSVNTTTGAIGFSGMSTDGLLFASSATAVGTNRCTMDTNQSMRCAASTAFTPQIVLTNTTNDGNSSYFLVDKNRAGGNTNSGDTIGNLLFRGFANAGQQNTAGVIGRQTAAATGSNIPSAIDIQTSTSSGQLARSWSFDGQSGTMTAPGVINTGANGGIGGSIGLFGSTSGSVSLQVPAAAGTTTFRLPGNNGTNLQVLQTDGAGVTSWVTTAAAATAPTKQFLLSGTGATYTTGTGARSIHVVMCAGGGGGGASTTNTGSTGSTTTFNSVNVTGGSGGGTQSGATGGIGGAGGTGGTGTAQFRLPGSGGGAGIGSGTANGSGSGGAGLHGMGGGRGGVGTATGVAGGANTCAGGSGGSTNNTGSGGGGGSGEYAELVIASPAGTYTYTVGGGGAGGAAGSNAGGNGGTGVIIVTEFYKFYLRCMAGNDNMPDYAIDECKAA